MGFRGLATRFFRRQAGITIFQFQQLPIKYIRNTLFPSGTKAINEP